MVNGSTSLPAFHPTAVFYHHASLTSPTLLDPVFPHLLFHSILASSSLLPIWITFSCFFVSADFHLKSLYIVDNLLQRLQRLGLTLGCGFSKTSDFNSEVLKSLHWQCWNFTAPNPQAAFFVQHCQTSDVSMFHSQPYSQYYLVSLWWSSPSYSLRILTCIHSCLFFAQLLLFPYWQISALSAASHSVLCILNSAGQP